MSKSKIITAVMLSGILLTGCGGKKEEPPKATQPTFEKRERPSNADNRMTTTPRTQEMQTRSKEQEMAIITERTEMIMELIRTIKYDEGNLNSLASIVFTGDGLTGDTARYLDSGIKEGQLFDRIKNTEEFEIRVFKIDAFLLKDKHNPEDPGIPFYYIQTQNPKNPNEYLKGIYADGLIKGVTINIPENQRINVGPVNPGSKFKTVTQPINTVPGSSNTEMTPADIEKMINGNNTVPNPGPVTVPEELFNQVNPQGESTGAGIRMTPENAMTQPNDNNPINDVPVIDINPSATTNTR